jgi:hypothetical protein
MMGITALAQPVLGTDCSCVKSGAFLSPDPGEVPCMMHTVRRDRSADAMMAPADPYPAGESS